MWLQAGAGVCYAELFAESGELTAGAIWLRNSELDSVTSRALCCVICHVCANMPGESQGRNVTSFIWTYLEVFPTVLLYWAARICITIGLEAFQGRAQVIFPDLSTIPGLKSEPRKSGDKDRLCTYSGLL